MKRLRLLPIFLLVVVLGTTYVVRGALTAFAASTYTVNSIGDASDINPGDDICETSTPGECTLRAAIEEANATAGTDTINFGITGSGLHTLTPASAYPPISESVTINGYSQTGASANTNAAPAGLNGTLTIEIDGSGAGVGVTGLTVNAASTIRGLVINGFSSMGIQIGLVGGTTVAGNYIGMNAAGTTTDANTASGINVLTAGNTIGGTSAADRNLLSGNGANGVAIADAAADNNTVQGNLLGTNAAGTTSRPNTFDGVATVAGATGNVIGGTATGAANILSGNGSDGIHLQSNSNTVQGNYLGVDSTGSADLGNDSFGVYLDGSDSNTIGGTDSGARNVISGNNSNGINLNDSDSNTILGNYIGTSVAGTSGVANSTHGISIGGDSSSNTVGGAASGARNVISGNTQSGISTADTATGTAIQGNYVGTNADGTAAIGNGSAGITTASGNATVGGTTTGARNVISGNGTNGVAAGNNVVIKGNYIGLNAAGDSVIANGASSPNVFIFGADNVTVGGSTEADRNVIAGPSSHGVQVLGATPFGSSAALNNKIQGNYIGTDASGVTHTGFGAGVGVVLLADAQDNLVGGTAAGEGNLIIGNGGGVAVSDFSTYEAINNSILGNSISENTGGSGATTIGIDLLGSTVNGTTFSDQGVTANDAGDTDVLSNHLMNFPVITNVSSADGEATITYNLDINDSESGATGYRVEFFANDSADPSGNGQGLTYLGSDTVSGDVTGETATITLASGVSGAKYITATTTMTDASVDGFGHSSEFSANTFATLVAATPDSGGGAGAGSDLAASGENIQWLWLASAVLLFSGLTGLWVMRRKSHHSGL